MSLKSSETEQLFLNHVQYWNLLFTPPSAAKHAFHQSSDQWIDCGNWFWRFSLILQKWIAQSASRCTCCEWRRRNVTFFDTSYSEKEHFPGSISIQFLLSIGTILGEEPAGSLLCGFAFAFDRHAKSLAFSLNAYSSSWFSGISVALLFKFITNLFDPWQILTQEWVLSLFKDIILISTPYLTVQITGCNFQHGPNFGVSLDPSFRLWGFFFSWKSVFTTGHCIKLWEFCSVFRHEILSDFNNNQKSCIHTNVTQFVLLW